MTDFYPMVLAAVSKLDPNTEEARRALYQRARAALADRLRDLEPPLSEQRIMEERLAFEEAVRRAEADWARGLVEHELLSKLADAIEHDVLLADPPQRTGQTWIHLSGTLRQARSGARFEPTEDGTFGFATTGTEADRATAADPLARSIRSELEYKARDLVGRASQISDRALWSSLIDPLRMFVEHIGGSEAEVAARIGTLWALYVALGAHSIHRKMPSHAKSSCRRKPMCCARCATLLPPAGRGFACSRPAAPSTIRGAPCHPRSSMPPRHSCAAPRKQGCYAMTRLRSFEPSSRTPITPDPSPKKAVIGPF